VPSGRQFFNPAPHVLDNGTIMCAYRAGARSGGEHVSVATAANPTSLYIDARAAPAVSHTGEDPFLWRDERGYYHMLMHNMGSGGCGAHAFSRDGATWTRSEDAPYTYDVEFSNNSSVTMRRRERPQLLLTPDGRPLFFSSGVEYASDSTYTLVMKFAV